MTPWEKIPKMNIFPKITDEPMEKNSKKMKICPKITDDPMGNFFQFKLRDKNFQLKLHDKNFSIKNT